MKRFVFNDIQEKDHELLSKELEGLDVPTLSKVEKESDLVLTSESPEEYNLKNKAMSVSEVKELDKFIAQGHYGQICEKVLAFDFPKAIFKRFATGDGSLQVETSFDKGFLVNRNLKVMAPDGIGYYADLVSSLSRSFGFNYIAVRNSLVSFFSYLQFLEMEKIGSFPIEVDYGCSSDSFFVQIHLDVEDFFIENIVESFSSESQMNPYSSLLRSGLYNADMVEIYTLKRSRKLVICGIWLSLEKREPDFFPSLLVHQVPFFERKELGLLSEDKISKIKLKKELNQSPRSSVGKRASVFSSGKVRNIQDLFKLKRLQDYIQRVKGKYPADSDIVEILSDYKNQEEVQRLSDSEKEVLKEYLSNQKLGEELDEVVKVVKGGFDDDSYLDAVSVVLDNLELDDVEEIVGGIDFFEADEEAQVVRGEKEDLGEETTLVSGTPDSDKDEKNYIVKGVTQHQKEEIWKVKRLSIRNKTKELISELRGKGYESEEIDQKVEDFLANELNAPTEKLKVLSQSISLKAGEEVSQEREASLAQIENRIELQRLNNVLSRKEDQNRRMKKVLDGLKSSYIKLQEKFNAIQSEKDDPMLSEHDSSDIKESSEESSSEDLMTQLKVLEEEKKKAQRLAEAREKDIEMWKKKFFNLKNTTEEGNNREVQKLNKEVDKLDVELQDAHSKVEDLANYKTLKELLPAIEGLFNEEVLNEIKNNAQAIEALESNDIEDIEMKEPEETSNDEEPKISAIELMEKDKKIDDLEEESRKSQDKIKSLNMALKTFEQKNKQQLEKIEKLQTELKEVLSKSNEDQAKDHKSTQRIKLLEKNLDKLQQANRKLLNELGEKKTELHKSNLENKTLNLKVKDFEKKINALKKRAA